MPISSSRTCFILLVLPLTFLAALGCSGAPASPGGSAEKPKSEADLARTSISRQAAESLGIQTQAVRLEKVQEHTQLPGFVMARPGCEVALTAPVAGYIRAPRKGTLPVAGMKLEKGAELFLLEPVLTSSEYIQMAVLKRAVENELDRAEQSYLVAQSEFERIEGLKQQGLRNTQDWEQALARRNQAKADFEAAQFKFDKLFMGDKGKILEHLPAALGLAGLAHVLRRSEKGKMLDHLPPTPITAPAAGTLLTVSVNPGQFVAASAPVATLADLSQPWVRVPVPEIDLGNIDLQQPATVYLGGNGKLVAVKATPFELVPLVDPTRHTADLFYQLPQDCPALAKDRLVNVLVPRGAPREESVVPYSAVIFDAYAGTWIYLDQTKDANAPSYERRRVELGPYHGDNIVVRPTLQAGEKVVTIGAASLFSREFHKPPVK